MTWRVVAVGDSESSLEGECGRNGVCGTVCGNDPVPRGDGEADGDGDGPRNTDSAWSSERRGAAVTAVGDHGVSASISQPLPWHTSDWCCECTAGPFPEPDPPNPTHLLTHASHPRLAFPFSRPHSLQRSRFAVPAVLGPELYPMSGVPFSPWFPEPIPPPCP